MYVLLVEGLDGEQRAAFDADLHGWTQQDKAAMARLLSPDDGGGGG